MRPSLALPNRMALRHPLGLATSALRAVYRTEQMYENSAMIQSGVLATDSRLTNITGTRIEMPFFDIFDPNEEVVESNATWGDNDSGYYTSQRITADTQYAPYCTRGFMHSMDDLSQYQTGEDALAHIRTKLAAARKNQPRTSAGRHSAQADNTWSLCHCRLRR